MPEEDLHLSGHARFQAHKSSPSGLRFDAIGKGAFSPCVRRYTNSGSALVKPRFLPHGVHINFPAVEQIDNTLALFIIASGQPPRFVHGTLDPFREQRSVKPTQWRPVAFHTY
jgi:hypothetical protein